MIKAEPELTKRPRCTAPGRAETRRWHYCWPCHRRMPSRASQTSSPGVLAARRCHVGSVSRSHVWLAPEVQPRLRKSAESWNHALSRRWNVRRTVLVPKFLPFHVGSGNPECSEGISSANAQGTRGHCPGSRSWTRRAERQEDNGTKAATGSRGQWRDRRRYRGWLRAPCPSRPSRPVTQAAAPGWPRGPAPLAQCWAPGARNSLAKEPVWRGPPIACSTRL